MPEIRYFVVDQTRQVKVCANSAAGAVLIAEQAFEGTDSTEVDGKPVAVWGSVSTPVKTTDIIVREDY